MPTPTRSARCWSSAAASATPPWPAASVTASASATASAPWCTASPRTVVFQSDVAAGALQHVSITGNQESGVEIEDGGTTASVSGNGNYSSNLGTRLHARLLERRLHGDRGQHLLEQHQPRLEPRQRGRRQSDRHLRDRQRRRRHSHRRHRQCHDRHGDRHRQRPRRLRGHRALLHRYRRHLHGQ